MIFSETLNFMLLFGDSEVYSGGNAGGSLTGPGAHSSTLWEALLPPSFLCYGKDTHCCMSGVWRQKKNEKSLFYTHSLDFPSVSGT